MKIDELGKYNLILYPLSKFQSDFELFFPELNIVGYIDDLFDIDKLNDKTVYKTKDLKSCLIRDRLIVICAFNCEQEMNHLMSLGLVEGRDFILGETIINAIDDGGTVSFDLTKVVNKKTIVFGAGEYASLLLREFSTLDIAYFIDNKKDKHNSTLHGKEIKAPCELLSEEKGRFIVIVAVSAIIDVTNQLEGMGFVCGCDFFIYEYGKRPASILLKKTISDKPKTTDWVCSLPFDYAFIDFGGHVFNCQCSDQWANLSIGNLQLDSFANIHNSAYAKIFRLSILNKTYSFCNEEQCYYLANRLVEKKLIEKKQNVLLQNYPSIVIPAYDNRCNLACPSCRNMYKTVPFKRSGTLDIIHKRFISELLPSTKRLFVAANGEVFLSDCYMDIINNFRGESLQILTNGTLFTEKKWNKIKHINNISFSCSIDAATKETYQLLRGGNFNTLLDNLNIVSELRKDMKIQTFTLNFVAQNANFREIPAFIELGKKLGVDTVNFCKILRFSHMSDAEYLEANIFDINHENHADLLTILNGGALDNPIVNAGNMRI